MPVIAAEQIAEVGGDEVVGLTEQQFESGRNRFVGGTDLVAYGDEHSLDVVGSDRREWEHVIENAVAFDVIELEIAPSVVQ